MTAAAIVAIGVCFVLLAAVVLWPHDRQSRTAVSDAQRRRREQIAMRMQGEAYFGEWWSE